ncbi:MAG: hypothetical protein R3B96_02125 [Pirellulaceae bacterium]
MMPSFWPGGRAIRPEILEGDTERQLEALWIYLEEGRQANVPRGLKREPIELLASDEAVMLRRSYPDVGKRGIGVGYPGGVNLVFDAEQLRLALLWQGGFADPAGVWRGQGHGTVRPLGRDVLRLAAGPELSFADRPWSPEDGRPSGYAFHGYQLDDQRRPTFRYEFAGLDVTDYSREEPGSDDRLGLRRTLTIAGELPDEAIVFRLARGGQIESRDGSEFVVDGRLRIQLPAELKTEIVDVGDERELQLAARSDSARSALAVVLLVVNQLKFDVVVRNALPRGGTSEPGKFASRPPRASVHSSCPLYRVKSDRMMRSMIGGLALGLLVLSTSALAQPLGEYWGTAEREDRYYKIVDLPIPDELALEAGSFEVLPDGRLAIGTRRGDIFLVDGVR